MKQDNPVPKLDLAPKLKRPLSLWNPLDYLRLLYWVFYFPQALRWYVDTFGGEYIPEDEMTWRKGLSMLGANAIQRQLLFQGLVLTTTVPVLFCLLLEYIGLEIAWGGVASGVASGIAFSMIGGVTGGVAFSMIGGVAFGAVLGVTFGIANDIVTVSVALGIACGLAVGGAFGMSGGWAVGRSGSMSGGVVFAVTGFVVGAGVFGWTEGGAGGVVSRGAFGWAAVVASIVAFGVATVVAIMRPENWFIDLVFNSTTKKNKVPSFPRITYLSSHQLEYLLAKWLIKDWETGIDNLNQLLKYSLQFIPIVKTTNKVLSNTLPEQVIFSLTQLSKNPYDWDLLQLVSIDLKAKLTSDFVKNLVDFSLFFLPRNRKESIKNKFSADIRLDTHYRAAAAGFWHLHKLQPTQAVEAFAVVKDLPYGEELYVLAQNLARFQQANNFKEVIDLEIINFPTENLLRPATWKAMDSLRRVVEDIKLIQHSASRNTKSRAYSSAIGELAEVINNQEDILAAERDLIVDISQKWKQALERIGKSIGDVAITKPVINPYVIGNPVTGSLFVGREDILRQLEELWMVGNQLQLQSVVLFGHRRMGKTSILVNIANNTGSDIKVVHLNLQRLGAVSQGVAEVLIAISDAVAKQLKIKSPADDDFLQLPQRSFERYIEQVISEMDYRGLIIALDEFETIEELIEIGQLDPRFMGFLRGLIQIAPDKLAFAFAGLHTLEEMTADYFQPFFASVIPINVGFISSGASQTLLANPINPIDEQVNNSESDFLLDYTREALDLIYSLTSGQPYLTQLIGFQLVRKYNDLVFESGESHSGTFTVEDVESIITDTFFQQGRYYFEGVWKQASQDAAGQQKILRVLATQPEGINKDKLVTATDLDAAVLNKAIAMLKKHDVIQEQNDQYSIIVELFRRWVIMSQI